MQFSVSGCLLGTGPASEVGYEPVQEAEDGLGVVVAFGEVRELAFEAEGDAEFGTDVQPVDIAGVVDMAGAAAGDVALSASRSVAELEFVAVAGHEPYYNHSSGVVVAWGYGASFEFVFEPKFGFVLVAASEAEYMLAPCENTQVAPFEVLSGAQFEPTVDNPEPVELDLGMESEPGCNPGGKVGVAL